MEKPEGIRGNQSRLLIGLLSIIVFAVLLSQIFPRYQQWIVGSLTLAALVFLLYRLLILKESSSLVGVLFLLALSISYFLVSNRLIQIILMGVVSLAFFFKASRGVKKEPKKGGEARYWRKSKQSTTIMVVLLLTLLFLWLFWTFGLTGRSVALTIAIIIFFGFLANMGFITFEFVRYVVDLLKRSEK